MQRRATLAAVRRAAAVSGLTASVLATAAWAWAGLGGRHAWTVQCDRGGIGFRVGGGSACLVGVVMYGLPDERPPPPAYDAQRRDALADARPDATHAGFGAEAVTAGRQPSFRDVFPYVAGVGVTSAPAWVVAVGPGVAGLLLWPGPNRPAPGLCRRCGYDLRGSPVRCPECGTAAADGRPPRTHRR